MNLKHYCRMAKGVFKNFKKCKTNEEADDLICTFIQHSNEQVKNISYGINSDKPHVVIQIVDEECHKLATKINKYSDDNRLGYYMDPEVVREFLVREVPGEVTESLFRDMGWENYHVHFKNVTGYDWNEMNKKLYPRIVPIMDENLGYDLRKLGIV